MAAERSELEQRFNFRADQVLAALIHRAAEAAGESVSEWLRSRAEQAAHQELAPPVSPRVLVLTTTAPCPHPRHFRRVRGLYEFCAGCGARLRSIL